MILITLTQRTPKIRPFNRSVYNFVVGPRTETLGRYFLVRLIRVLYRCCRAVFFTLILLSFHGGVSLADTAAIRTGTVVKILDGDTIEVLFDSQTKRIRLHGIDCPERGQAFAERAKQATAELCFQKLVTLQVHDVDRYGRLVATVKLPNSTIVNRELVKSGLCWWYRRYAPNDTVLSLLESQARENKRGVWSLPNPTAPWLWRKSTPRSVPAATDGPIIGNRRSRVFHEPHCPSYSLVSEKNRIHFTSPSEALANGYRRAGNCR